jgi:ABC-type multidrug transport system fused ATPase/permease subunit
MYFKTLTRVYGLLDTRFRRRFIAIQLLIVVTALVDLLGLAMFIPLIGMMAEPERIADVPVLLNLKVGMGIAAHYDFIAVLFGIALIFFLFRTLFIIYSMRIQQGFSYDITAWVARSAFGYYLGLPYEEFAAKKSAKIIRELNVSPLHFSRFLVMPILLLSTEFLVMGFIAAGILWYDWKIALLLGCTLLPSAWLFNRFIKGRMRHMGLEENELSAQAYAHSLRGVFGFIDVRLRHKASVLLQDLGSVFFRLRDIFAKSASWAVMPPKLFEFMTVLGLFIIFWYAAYISAQPTQAFTLIILFAAAGYRLAPAMGKVMPSLMMLQQYEYLFDVYKESLASKREIETIAPEALIDFVKIEIRTLTFAYHRATQHALNGIQLLIERGEVLGVIGRSGSGKSTLALLLAGLLKPSSGQIMIDDKVLNDSLLSAWMAGVSFVQQQPYIEQGTLAHNIAFLDDEIDETRLQRSIRLAALDDFVQGRSPMEIHLEEGGKNLSGGQKQRITIARALYHDARFLILDEATSSLDNETEFALLKTLENLKQEGLTMLIIAHRYTTLRGCDRIIRVAEGKVAEELQYNQIKMLGLEEEIGD